MIKKILPYVLAGMTLVGAVGCDSQKPKSLEDKVEQTNVLDLGEITVRGGQKIEPTATPYEVPTPKPTVTPFPTQAPTEYPQSEIKVAKEVYDSTEARRILNGARELNIYIDEVVEKIDLSEYIDKEFLIASAYNESSFKSKSKSNKGARGLFQVTKIAWEEVDKRNYNKYVNDPRVNTEVGIKYKEWLGEQLEENHPYWNELSKEERQNLVIASYNGGFGRLKKRGYDISAMPLETQNHVRKIRHTYNLLKEAKRNI